MPEDTEDNAGDRVNERQGIMPEDTEDNEGDRLNERDRG